MKAIIELVRSLDMSRYRQDRILSFLVIDAPYPISYLPPHLQIAIALGVVDR